ncbi:copper resistance CopC family protein [Arthrobacter sp. Marseille-P9274]|uniref:copper resistance CopC family protein n=1 Tax=Arthrobacter sp. Marseille-P9274 TaxID=2866572 RepID=UPI0021C8BC79|nr:copper resistance CopC family protein [Arthrobacter sp. Marseille-P9274]
MKSIPAAARYLLAALLAAALVLFPAAAAQAHDELAGHAPEQGERLDKMPDGVTLDFTGVPVALGSVVQIMDSSGTDWAEGDVQILDKRVTQPVKDGAPAGSYTVNWRVVSSDSHPIEGTFGFTVGAGSTPGPSTAPGAGAGTPQPLETGEANPVKEPGTEVAGQSVPWSVVAMAAVLVVLAVVIGVMAKRRLGRDEE